MEVLQVTESKFLFGAYLANACYNVGLVSPSFVHLHVLSHNFRLFPGNIA